MDAQDLFSGLKEPDDDELRNSSDNDLDASPDQKVFVLNPGQKEAHDNLVNFILGKTAFRWVLLTGWAGTGKTFVINRVVETMRLIRHYNFGMTAPTHKAVRQLRKHSELKDVLEFGTIHSFLGLKEKIHQVTGKVTYELDWESTKERKIDHIDVLIIDESSMLRDDLFGHIDDVVRNRPNLKVIFMGDALQIPPVRDKDDEKNGTNINAIPFVEAQRHSRKIGLIELTDIVRQGEGNPIIEYSKVIRESMKKNVISFDFPEPEPDHGIQVLHTRDIKVLEELFSKYFCTPNFEEDADYVKVVCYRNSSVKYFNNVIRLLIFKAETLPRIVTNERLVMDAPLLKGKKILLPNNEELIVNSVVVTDLPLRYRIIPVEASAFNKVDSVDDMIGASAGYREHTFKVYRAVADTLDGKRFSLDILHEDSQADYDHIQKRMVDNVYKLSVRAEKGEQWGHFYKMKEQFAWVSHNYAITAHKSQGSTYDYCISMEWDIETVRNLEERNRIRYVAATRARNKLYIIK